MNPNKKACIFENTSYTYKELNEKANRLAHMLVSNNIGNNTIIGIMLPRCLDLLSCVWGVLKSGNGYMLIDPSLPQDRIKYMLENANASLLITNSDMQIDFNNKFLADTSELVLNNETKKIDFSNYSLENPNIDTSNENTFCVIYTSGSTGNPKGVLVKHKNIVRLVINQNFIKFNSHEVMVQTGTIAFDACIFEIFGALLHGFKLHILKKDILLNINKFENFLV